MLLPPNSVEYRRFSALVIGVVALLCFLAMLSALGGNLHRHWQMRDAVETRGRVIAVKKSGIKPSRIEVGLEYQMNGKTYQIHGIELSPGSSHTFASLEKARVSGDLVACYVARDQLEIADLDRPGDQFSWIGLQSLGLVVLSTLAGFVSYRYLTGYYRINSQIKRSKVRKKRK